MTIKIGQVYSPKFTDYGVGSYVVSRLTDDFVSFIDVNDFPITSEHDKKSLEIAWSYSSFVNTFYFDILKTFKFKMRHHEV